MWLSTLLALAVLSPASIQLDRDANGTSVVRVVGGAAGKIKVYVGSEANSDLPAVLGNAAPIGNDLIFTPRFPLEPGREYRVEYVDKTTIGKVIRVPESARATGNVVRQVYPSADELPANQLKLYFEFSAPMSRGEAYRHVHLFNAAGHEVEQAFLELGEELWDSDQTRFTLLFDPGRIKRDLVPNMNDGTPLQQGQRYLLKVDANWPDSHGRPLMKAFTKEFTVVAPDRTAPDPQSWTLKPPTANSRGALAVNFPEPMDFGLLQRSLQVVAANGVEINGSIALDNHERRWLFTPTEPWTDGEYRLQIEGTLEDLAGNRIGRLFEVDTRGLDMRAAAEIANRPNTIFSSLTFRTRRRE